VKRTSASSAPVSVSFPKILDGSVDSGMSMNSKGLGEGGHALLSAPRTTRGGKEESCEEEKKGELEIARRRVEKMKPNKMSLQLSQIVNSRI